MSNPLDEVEGIIRNSTILTEPEANNCFTIITRVIIVEEKETHAINVSNAMNAIAKMTRRYSQSDKKLCFCELDRYRIVYLFFTL